MKKQILLASVVIILSGCNLFKKEEVVPVNAPETLTAKAVMHNTKGELIGEVIFTEKDEGVELAAVLNGLPQGEHGIHIHETGKCDAPKFELAGAHFNPTNKKHGIENAEGPHVGDLPNLTAAEDGSVQLNFIATNFTLKKGESNSLFDSDGSAVVIHEKADDYKTDPSGNSGARIACGVIE
ncbi:superoxide dismutase family protein [Solibacillus sp. FSL H8-0538]|uniref:superoxide dismutase family protein n=1 Tax=Solibacillus sp. FSL H8-0538 TaxID=2921400 RepID=UPI0030F66A0E